MGNRPGQKIKLTSIDELLCVPQTAGTTDVDVNAIYPFENHPFKVLDDEKMEELVDSIKLNGILTPVIVRPDDEGTYEMISGHRRLHAAKRAGLQKIPAIVKEMTNDDAILAMVDSNLQREEILPSEKAFAYKMKYDAMKRKAGRPQRKTALDRAENGAQDGLNNSAQVGRNLETGDILAQQVGESRNTVKRYIRLTELIPELLNLVDEKRLPFVTGYEMTFFTREIQRWLYEYCRENGIPKWDQVNGLRGVDMAKLTQEELIQMLNGIRPAQTLPSKITFTERKLNQYLPKYMSMPEKERLIITLLEKWKEEHEEG